MYQQVCNFHLKFELSPLEDAPALLTTKAQLYRLARMLEELHEFQAAYLRGDLVKASDALADLVYFALGTAHLMGLPFESIFNMVHAANMRKIKVTDATKSKYGDHQDIVKPDDWTSPEPLIALTLEKYGHVPPK